MLKVNLFKTVLLKSLKRPRWRVVSILNDGEFTIASNILNRNASLSTRNITVCCNYKNDKNANIKSIFMKIKNITDSLIHHFFSQTTNPTGLKLSTQVPHTV